MLTFDSAAIQILIEKHRRALNRVEAMQKITNGWGCGPIVSNFAGLQGAFFSLLGRTDRKPGEYPRDPGDGSAGATNESFHPIVRIRKLKLQNYNPMALQGYKLQDPHGGTGWEWAKTGVQAVPEYILRPKLMSVAYEEGGRTKYGFQNSLSRLMCPADILAELDKDNGIKE